jgi:nucleoside-diphosphate-sugar epimerase
MYDIDTAAPVMVTGATGYVAGWILKALVEAGVTVHAPVRDPSNEEKIKHLIAMADRSAGAIRFFEADLLDQGSYGDAMAGCRILLHTASPFTTSVSDPQRELVDPALLGTRNVLAEADRTPSVRRIVLTSSCAAIYGDNIDVAKAPGGVLTEEVWNTSSSLAHQPYSYSKTLAEREAWRIAGAQA